MKKLISAAIAFACIIAASSSFACTRVVYIEVTPSPSATPTASPIPTATPTMAPTATPSNAISSVDPETIRQFLDASLEDTDSFTFYVEYDEKSNLYTVYSIGEGVAYAAQMRMLDASGYQDAWDGMVDSFIGINNTSTEIVRALGSSALVCCVLLNDLDTEKAILSSLDSVIIYDATK